jgi:predicted Zn finger-like uncharacterized protein
MTLQQKYLIPVTEIAAVQFQCPKCKSSLSVVPAQLGYGAPDKCPRCNELWNAPAGSQNTVLDDFVIALSNLKNFLNTRQLNVNLEVAPPYGHDASAQGI